jgi:hypothetical protein
VQELYLLFGSGGNALQMHDARHIPTGDNFGFVVEVVC